MEREAAEEMPQTFETEPPKFHHDAGYVRRAWWFRFLHGRLPLPHEITDDPLLLQRDLDLYDTGVMFQDFHLG